ncbi:MAG: endonuclease/exonuclease/phosphatase family protein [Actinomycetota bacterium]|nr:endonuclease/exonuclease/phosphatase family protein [Actinomycetota bacterium]
MTAIKVGTFNVENLFIRYRFKDNIDPSGAVRDGWDINQTRFEILNDTDKRITAKTILEADADVLALQEVENLEVLKRFRSEYLKGTSNYPFALVVDGNDPRLIDVALLSRLPILHVRSYQYLRVNNSRSFIFSRDCLEVGLEVTGGTVLTLFINHLKSMVGGRAATRERRQLQARTVKEIVSDVVGARPADQPFVVLGDLNDYPEPDPDGTTTAIEELVKWDQVENVLERLPEKERWTHYFARRNTYRQLDYLLPSRSLAANAGQPEVIRKGLPLRADEFEGERFEGIGEDRPKASDHCPVVLELEL